MSAPEVADRLLLVPGRAGPDAPVVLARAQWPAAEDDALPAIAGFTLSTFSPLVAETAERCLRARYGTAPARPTHAGSTALVLASADGDTTTTETAQATAEAGGRVPPLLFFQSNPNAVLGWIAARWQLDGPVLSIAPVGDPLADGQAVAELLIADGEAAEVLVIAAELDPDRAEAVLLGHAADMSLVLAGDDPAPVADLVVPESPTVPVTPDPAPGLVLAEPAAGPVPDLALPEPAAGPTVLVLPEPAPAPAAALIVPTALEER